jgi:hypothetical protein
MNGMKQTCLVLSASTYEMTDEKTGKQSSGLTVFYLPTDNLAPQADELAKSRGQMGHGIQPSKVTLPIEKKTKIVNAPALYELTFQMVTRQLKTQVQPVDIDYIAEAELKRVPTKAG